jgi:acyl-CoA dehydrogenase
LRSEARTRGLYHLFSATGADDFPFSTLQFAELAEITGYSPFLAQDALGSLNPDAEVINLLHRFGSDVQRGQWLARLADGDIGSALCITEPGVASSDPAGLTTRATERDNEFLMNGEKSWALGALSPLCELLVVLALTDPGPRHCHSLLLVPRRAAGVQFGEASSFFGYRNEARGGMAHIRFNNVKVPQSALLGPRGEGLATAQTSLGPARLFHCMRLIGAAERALRLLCNRASSRSVGGEPLVRHGLWLDRIAEARIRIEQARAVTLGVAATIDAHGLSAARTGISLAKAFVPSATEWVIDMAIQAHGSDGMSHELPLAAIWAWARTLRFSDGPDEAHRMAVARAELKRGADRSTGLKSGAQ